MTTSGHAALMYFCGAFLVAVWRVLACPRRHDTAWDIVATMAVAPAVVVGALWATGRLKYKGNTHGHSDGWKPVETKEAIHWTTAYLVGLLLLFAILTLSQSESNP